MSATDTLAAALRSVHFVACAGLLGTAAALLFAGPTDRPTALAWQRRMTAWARALVPLALLSGVAIVAQQTAVLEGRAAAAAQPSALLRLLLETQGGVVWLMRHGLLLVLATFLAMRGDLSLRADWRAARLQTALLAGAGFALLAAGGHAAAVEPDTRAAIAADMAHLLVAGAWAGALVPLAVLLAGASAPAGADARPYAVVAVRRFSRWALPLVVVLAATGVVNTAMEVGSIAGLIGTRHGRILCAKLAIFALVLGVAAINRGDLRALSGPAEALGRPAMRRIARGSVCEAACVLVILVLSAVLTITPPARHQQPTWPLSFRLSVSALDETPALRPQVLVGSQVAVLGMVAVLAALLWRRRRLPLAAGGAVVLLAGAAMALPPLVVDAYPTTYRRPAVPYAAGSIAAGAPLYAEHCASCHGREGRGDGPAGRGLVPPPADLRGGHAAAHTAGDIFWWIGHGRRAMPAFADRIDVAGRWHLVNFLRALAASDAARTLGARIEPDRPRVVAPDFAFGVGPARSRALRDYRGRRHVLVVLYTLPGSRPRLGDLARRYDLLVSAGVEVIAVPVDAAPNAIARLGAVPAVFYPIVTAGAADIVRAYGLFAPPPHAEFLVDRAGYLRAITRGAGDVDTLLANVGALDRETVAPPADVHAH